MTIIRLDDWDFAYSIKQKITIENGYDFLSENKHIQFGYFINPKSAPCKLITGFTFSEEVDKPTLEKYVANEIYRFLFNKTEIKIRTEMNLLDPKYLIIKIKDINLIGLEN